jgi:hypothetical protein
MTTIAAPLTNRVPDPSAESAIGGAQASAAATLYPITYDTTIKHSGTRSVRTDRTTTTLNVNVGVVNMTPTAFANIVKVAVTPGEIVSAAAMIRCLIPESRGRVTLAWRDSANAVVGTNTLGDIAFLDTSGAWNYVTLGAAVATAPAGAALVTLQPQVLLKAGQVCVGGEQAWFDSLMLNSGPVINPYFDGDTPGCKWMGPGSGGIIIARSPSQQSNWQVWDGTKLVYATPEGLFDGSAVVPQTYVDIAVV